MTDAFHHEAELLLPWYANGTLDASDMDLVAGHVAHCDRCTRALAEQLTLGPQFAVDDARTTALLARQAAARRKLGAQLHNLPPEARGRWRLTLAAVAAALAVGIATPLVVHIGAPQPDFRTLSQPAANPGVVVQVLFAENATRSEIDAVLAEIGGTSLDGPSPLGVHRIELRPGVDARSLTSRIAENPAVRLAALE